MTEIGHNTNAGGRLRALVERVEQLEAEKAEVADHIKEVYAEAKAVGYDTKTLRKVVRLKKVPAEQRQEEEAMLATYLHALGLAVFED